MKRIASAGVGFRSLTENTDTIMPTEQMIPMMSSFAELERPMIRDRTSAGLAVVGAEDRVSGRREKLDTAKQREVAESVITGCKSGADVNSSKINPRSARVPDEYRPTTASTNSSRVAMLIRLITAPNKIRPGANQGRQYTNRWEHFRQGNASFKLVRPYTGVCGFNPGRLASGSTGNPALKR